MNSPGAFDAPLVHARHLGKRFPAEPSAASAFRLLRGWLRHGPTASQTVAALEDVSFTLQAGERLGLVGDNGAGKTTLLKTIAGLYRPTSGDVTVNGELALLAGLGVGMLEPLTVRENLILSGAIHGVERRHTLSHMDDILAWAQLEAFADARFKTLSSGMRTRLAFSAVRYIDKDVYLMDEALTAGDKNFADRCQAVFDDYRQRGKTFVVASHNLKFVANFCTQVLWLQKGRVAGLGPTDVVLEQYRQKT